MAKFYGIIGYVETVETSPGIWTEETTERAYYGEVINRSSRWSTSPDSTNDNLSLDAQISIVADPFAYQKFHAMRYIEYMGAKWKIDKVDPQRPRLVLTLGGVYNGK